jgi:transposase
MTYSLDFRQHVLKIKASDKLSFAAIAQRFKIGKNSLFLWSKQRIATSKRNKPAAKIDMDALREDVIKYPDAYQYERAIRFGVSQTGILAALKRLGVSYKKNMCSSKGRTRCEIIVSKENSGLSCKGGSYYLYR